MQELGSRKIRLKSWKGDYLHRPDSAQQGVTSYHTGKGNEWTIEKLDSGKISLKSWKGDYLHRPDSPQGVTSYHTGKGNEWTLEEAVPPEASAVPAPASSSMQEARAADETASAPLA